MPEDQTLAEYWGENAEELERWFATQAVLDDIADERQAQHRQWGDQMLPMGTGNYVFGIMRDHYRTECQQAHADGKLTYQHILLEEVFEALAEERPAEAEGRAGPGRCRGREDDRADQPRAGG